MKVLQEPGIGNIMGRKDDQSRGAEPSIRSPAEFSDILKLSGRRQNP